MVLLAIGFTIANASAVAKNGQKVINVMTNTKKPSTSHVVMAPWGHYKCNHCGATKKATTPAKIQDFIAEGRAFTAEHENCKKTDNLN